MRNGKTARGPEAGAVHTPKPRRGYNADGTPLDPAHPWAKVATNEKRNCSGRPAVRCHAVIGLVIRAIHGGIGSAIPELSGDGLNTKVTNAGASGGHRFYAMCAKPVLER